MNLNQLFAHWQQVRTDLLSVVDEFSNEELSYAPFEGAWPAGRIMLHIADTEDGWFRYVVRRELSGWPEDYRLQKYPTKDAIKGLLTRVHTQTEAYLATLALSDLERVIETPWDSTLTLEWIIWHVLEHEIHHRGELSLMLGLLGREGLDV